MANGESLGQMRERLRRLQEVRYSLHAERDALPDRRLSKELVEALVREPEGLLSVEQQSEGRWRLVFARGKRAFLALVVRFIDEWTITVITAHPVSGKRLRRYMRWSRG